MPATSSNDYYENSAAAAPCVLERAPAENKFFGWTQQNVYDAAEKCFWLVAKCSQRTSLIPIEQKENGSFGLISKCRAVFYAGIFAAGFASLAYKLCICLRLLFQKDFSVRTFVSVASFLVTFVAWLPAVALAYVPAGAADLLNSWASVLDRASDIDGHRRSLILDAMTAMNVICLAFLPTWMATAGGMLFIVFQDLPVSCLTLLRTLGVVNEEHIVFWRCGSFLLEFVLNFLLWLSLAFVSMLMFMGIGVLKTFGRLLRLVHKCVPSNVALYC